MFVEVFRLSFHFDKFNPILQFVLCDYIYLVLTFTVVPVSKASVASRLLQNFVKIALKRLAANSREITLRYRSQFIIATGLDDVHVFVNEPEPEFQELIVYGIMYILVA